MKKKSINEQSIWPNLLSCKLRAEIQSQVKEQEQRGASRFLTADLPYYRQLARVDGYLEGSVEI
jgi:hypothetical protein